MRSILWKKLDDVDGWAHEIRFVLEDVKSSVAALEKKDREAAEDIQSLGKKLKVRLSRVQWASRAQLIWSTVLRE